MVFKVLRTIQARMMEDERVSAGDLVDVLLMFYRRKSKEGPYMTYVNSIRYKCTSTRVKLAAPDWTCLGEGDRVRTSGARSLGRGEVQLEHKLIDGDPVSCCMYMY